MPQDLYDHVQASLTWRDDLFLFGVYLPVMIALLLVVACCAIVIEPVRWIRRLMAARAETCNSR